MNVTCITEHVSTSKSMCHCLSRLAQNQPTHLFTDVRGTSVLRTIVSVL
jgi:hypothetical protein